MDSATTLLSTGEEVNEYLSTLLKGKAQIGSSVEGYALESFRAVSVRVDTLEADLQRAQNQVAQIRAQMNESSGEMKAYVNLLISAERARRQEAAAAKIEAKAVEIKNVGSLEDAPPDTEGSSSSESETSSPINLSPLKGDLI